MYSNGKRWRVHRCWILTRKYLLISASRMKAFCLLTLSSSTMQTGGWGGRWSGLYPAATCSQIPTFRTQAAVYLGEPGSTNHSEQCNAFRTSLLLHGNDVKIGHVRAIRASSRASVPIETAPRIRTRALGKVPYISADALRIASNFASLIRGRCCCAREQKHPLFHAGNTRHACSGLGERFQR